eukprot:jgi/Botrbrau1/3200/Bobra.37_2s0030.1
MSSMPIKALSLRSLGRPSGCLPVTGRPVRCRKINTPFCQARHDVKVASDSPLEVVSARLKGFLQQTATKVAVGAALGTILLGQPAFSADYIRFPAAEDPAVFAAQKTLVEAWTIVEEAYVDGDFGGNNWERELASSLMSAYKSPNGEAAYSIVMHMVEKLGDPFTRLVPAQEYADFRVSSDGEVQGVGLLIASDPNSGRLVVLAPIIGGPADRAGMLPGDEVLSIDGAPTDGWDGDRAAKVLRGKSGSSVSVKFARRSEQIPGVAGRPEPPPMVEYKQVNLKREKLNVNPVFSTAMLDDEGNKLGYIRLVNFSQKAAQEVERSMRRFEAEGVDGFILDLRNNPGGLVKAGLDVARLWLDGSPTIFNVQGREEGGSAETMQRVVLDEGKAVDGHTPLAVLVNSGSASASEILAGALHDNHRATVIGSQTFGKGKIQSVFELEDGSALFVTVAKYKTPDLHDIDKVGIQPDSSCSTPGQEVVSSPPQRLSLLASDLDQDSCLVAAKAILKNQMLGSS